MDFIRIYIDVTLSFQSIKVIMIMKSIINRVIMVLEHLQVSPSRDISVVQEAVGPQLFRVCCS